jgi:hypothetical protein
MHKWEDNTIIHVSQDRVQWQATVNINKAKPVPLHTTKAHGREEE